MILPNREKAFVPSEKLYDYLLSTTHPDGKSKASFFRLFGFTDSNANLLESALISIAQSEAIVTKTKSPFGVKYVIDGHLTTPVGITVNVRTVWIIEIDYDAPRFVTAYPNLKN